MGPISRESPLSGLGVLVTRPKLQAEGLCVAIESKGGRVIRFPVVEIADPVNLDPIYRILNHLDDYDIAIFISPNAVLKTLNAMKRERLIFPQSLQIAAIGKGSVNALNAKGVSVDVYPQHQFNSEALLAQEGMHHVQNKRILIFRGEGGREVLAETLRQRGANVSYAEVYRRILPDFDITTLVEMWSGVDVVTVTSNEGLQNLYNMTSSDGHVQLLSTQLLVISHRAVSLAKKLGFSKPVWVTKEVSNDAIIEVLQKIKLKLDK